MKLNKLSDELQTLCHAGFSECKVGIKILDAFYNISDVKMIRHKTGDITFFVIDTEVKNDGIQNIK